MKWSVERKGNETDDPGKHQQSDSDQTGRSGRFIRIGVFRRDFRIDDPRLANVIMPNSREPGVRKAFRVVHKGYACDQRQERRDTSWMGLDAFLEALARSVGAEITFN